MFDLYFEKSPRIISCESDSFTCLGGCKLNKFWLSIGLSAALLLGACGNADSDSTTGGSTDDGEAANENAAIDHGVKDKTDEREVGFNLSGEDVERAEDVSAEEETKIIAALDEHIATFNEKDIDAYMNTLSEKTESFDLEEERTYMAETFAQYELDRSISNVTITKYSASEANVFTTMVTVLKELASDEEVTMNGRQVTVLTKDDGEWKVASVHYIGDELQ